MNNNQIDKKKQFQILNVQSKLDNYKQTLNTLLATRKILSENIILINPNNENIDKLNNDKKNIENNLKTLKNKISKTINDIAKLKASISELPLLRDKKNDNEKQILIQELNRIEMQKNENCIKYDILINKAHLNKLNLIDNINIIKNSIEEQNNILLNIQTNSHSSRKDILLELHQKKKDKNNIDLQQNEILKQNDIINIQIIELETKLKHLEEFKILLVNENYNTSLDV